MVNNGDYRKPLANTTLIITVKLFVTTARLALCQTSVITVKICARRGKICPTGEELAPLMKIPVVGKI